MKCTVCGTENPDNAKFCGICGRPFAEQTSPNPQSYAASGSSEFNAGFAPTASAAPASDLGANAAPTSEYPPRTEPLPESANQFNSEPTANFSPEAARSLDSSPASESAVNPAPTPVPSVPQDSRFSNSGLKDSFAEPEKADALKKEKGGRHEKEKEQKVVSLSVAVFCIISVFILAVFCGVLTQICMRKISGTGSTDTANLSCSASEDDSARFEYILNSSPASANCNCKGE